MATNDGSGNGAPVVEGGVKTSKSHEWDNRARFSSVLLNIFSWVVLVAGFFMSIKYFNDAGAINDMSYSNRERFAELQQLYYFYGWVYPISGVITFATLNVINAIYIKLYPRDFKSLDW